MDLSQYLSMFFEESKEHLQALNDHLMTLEKDPTHLQSVQEIFRSAHTLKGMAATMGFNQMASMTHKMENALDLIRNGQQQVTPRLLDALFYSFDMLEKQLESIAESGTDETVDVTEALNRLHQAVSEEIPAALFTEPTAAVEQVKETIHVQTTLHLSDYVLEIIHQSTQSGFQAWDIRVKLDASCVMKAVRAYMIHAELEQLGEILYTEPSVSEMELESFDSDLRFLLISQRELGEIQNRVASVGEVATVDIAPFQVASKPMVSEPEVRSQPKQAVEEHKKQTPMSKTMRVDLTKLDQLMNLFSEWVIDRSRLEQIAKEIARPDLTETVEHISRLGAELQSNVMSIRMTPVETVFNRFPRMIRDLSRDLAKKVEFTVLGAETELDRTVIDEIGEPLVHMLRNALDHGLESPAERVAQGKPEVGTLELKAYHSGNRVFIEIREDGRGIDKAKVLQKALEKRLVTEVEAASYGDEQIHDLIFSPGFSTAEIVSDISGRGVGLDVVKTKIESLGGRIITRSRIHQGTTFIIELPLTLSIIQAMLVKLAGTTYAVPLSSVIETAMVKREEIVDIHNIPYVSFREQWVPFIDAVALFEHRQQQEVSEFPMVIIKTGEHTAALGVDVLLGQQEIVLKSLGSYLSGNVPGISGATILGDGQIALLVDTHSIMRTGKGGMNHAYGA